MINTADLVGLNDEQARRFQELDRDVSQSREAIQAWHRLLDRRRTDIKLGLHAITGFALSRKPSADAAGNLVRQDPEPNDAAPTRQPFFVRSEAEARGLLMRCIDYLASPDGAKLAHDKGYGERDKLAEWIMMEIRTMGGLAYIRKHAPLVFGIPLAVADA